MIDLKIRNAVAIRADFHNWIITHCWKQQTFTLCCIDSLAREHIGDTVVIREWNYPRTNKVANSIGFVTLTTGRRVPQTDMAWRLVHVVDIPRSDGIQRTD